MNLGDWKLPNLFRSRKSQERDAYLAGSLDTAGSLSKLISSCSGDPKTHPVRMNFALEWTDPGCPVMKWYKLHTCTGFESVQHWQETDTLAMHEFLLVLLTDGSVCRIERMGEGSRADAIRRIGCTAHDLIQWFSPADYAAGQWIRAPQRMIMQVDFPRTFDLLDILAVCYTIYHQHPRASTYTLQRFNCYFLCNTILVVLTRRVAQWETMIAAAEWPTLVDNMIDELKQISSMREKLEKQHTLAYLSFGIPSLLDPNSPDPASFLLEPLRLKLKDNGLHDIAQELAKLLWCKHINGFESGVDESEIIDLVKKPTSDSPAFSLHTLLKDVDPQRYPPLGINLDSIRDAVSHKLLTLCSKVSSEIAASLVSLYQFQELEHKPPLFLWLTASILGPLACTIPMPLVGQYLKQRIRENDDDGDIDRFCSRLGVTIGQLLSSVPLAARSNIVKLFYMSNNGHDPTDGEVAGNDLELEGEAMFLERVSIWIQWGVESIFPLLQAHLHSDSGITNKQATLAFLNQFLPMEAWEFCVAMCLGKLITGRIQSLVAHQPGSIVTHSMSNTQLQTAVQTVPDFQDFIQQRIKAHAERVESYKLASATLVQRDIERSMIQIWLKLPDGYGAVKVQQTSSIDVDPSITPTDTELSLTTLS